MGWDDELVAAIAQLPAGAGLAWLAERQLTADMALVEGLKAWAEEISAQGDLAQAIQTLDRAEEVAEQLPDPLALGLVWRGRANVYQRHDCFEESLAASQTGAEIYARQSTPLEVAKTRTQEVYTLGALGRFEEAITLAGWIQEQFAGFPLGQAFLATNLAQVYTWAWRLDDALTEHQRAQDLYTSLQQPKRAARVLMNMGVTAEQLDQLGLAEQYYQQAYPALKEANDQFVSAKALHNLALLCWRQGRYETALSYLDQARQDLGQLANAPDLAYVDMYEARVRRELHQTAEAERLLALAEERFSQPGYQFELAETLIEKAHLSAQLGTPEKLAQGLDCLERSAKILATYPVSALQVQVQLETGEFLLRLERPLEAQQRATTANEIFAQLGLSLRQSWAVLLLADCTWQIRPDQAQQLYRSALEQADQSSPLLGARGWHGLARLAMAQDNWAEAESFYLNAWKLIRLVQHSLAGHAHRAGFLENRQNLLDDLINLLRQQPTRRTDLLHWVEQAKAQALADLLAGQPVDLNTDTEMHNLLTERRRLRDALDQQMRIIHGNLPGSIGEPRRSAELQQFDGLYAQEIKRLQEELQHLDEQIARRQDASVQWRDADITDAPDTHALLEADTLYLCYFECRGRLYALTVSQAAGDIQLHDLDTNLSSIMRTWEHTSLQLARSQPAAQKRVQSRLSSLWRSLIAPLESRLRPYQRLLVSPYRGLHLIPFAALFDPERSQYLVENWTLQIVPNLMVLSSCRVQSSVTRPPLLIGYAGQLGEAGYLPGVEPEIAAVQAYFPNTEICQGDQATPEAVLATASHRPFVHFAGHVYYDPQNPLASGLSLANQRWLRASDLYIRRGLLQGSLVVLSGCESGIGKPSGGEILGLTSAFLYAGASALMASLWKVDDAATFALMTAFYNSLRSGVDAAAALQNAQLALLAQSEYGQPYHWAGFELTGGNWKQ